MITVTFPDWLVWLFIISLICDILSSKLFRTFWKRLIRLIKL